MKTAKEILEGFKKSIKPKRYEDKYDAIMKEAREIFEWQDKCGNPYAMHVAVENAIKQLEKLNNEPN